MHLVMFDVDGTLVNSDFDDNLYRKALKGMLDLDCPDSYHDILHVTDNGILGQLYLEKHFRDITSKELNSVRDAYSDMVMDALLSDPSDCRALPGALELFSSLQNSPDHMVAIATGGWGPTACFKLAHSGFEINRLIMATGDDHHERTGIMMIARERAEDRLGNPAGFDRITYVGDGTWDRDAARVLDWPLVIIGDKVPAPGDGEPPFIQIADFTDARSIFGLNSQVS